MTMINLHNPKGYVLDPNSITEFGNMNAVETLSYFINNIMIFEQSIFASMRDNVKQFKNVLDLSDSQWLYNFFNKKVYIVDNNTTEFHWTNAIAMKVVCEKLLYDKYTLRDSNLEEFPVPQLPNPDSELEKEYLNIYFREHIDDRIKEYRGIIKYYEQFHIHQL